MNTNIDIQVIDANHLQTWSDERGRDKQFMTGLADSYNLDRDDTDDHYPAMLARIIELSVMQGPVQMALWLCAAAELLADQRRADGVFESQVVPGPRGMSVQVSPDGLTILGPDGLPCECGCNDKDAEPDTFEAPDSDAALEAQIAATRARCLVLVERLHQQGKLDHDKAELFKVAINTLR